MFYSGTPDPILFPSTEASELNPEDKKKQNEKAKMMYWRSMFVLYLIHSSYFDSFASLTVLC